MSIICGNQAASRQKAISGVSSNSWAVPHVVIWSHNRQNSRASGQSKTSKIRVISVSPNSERLRLVSSEGPQSRTAGKSVASTSHFFVVSKGFRRSMTIGARRKSVKANVARIRRKPTAR